MAGTKKELAKNVPFDMGEFDSVTKSNEGVWIPILHPITGEETTTRFCMLGYDSDEYIAWRDAQSKKSQRFFIQEMAKGKTKSKEQEDLELDDDIGLLCVLTKDWEEAYWNGEKLSFTPENLKMILTRNTVVRNQLRRDVDDRERFFMVTSSN